MSKALAEGTTLYIFSELGMFFMLSISFIDKHLEVSSLCKTLGKMESSGGCRERGRLRVQTLETGHLGVGLTFTFTVFLGNDLEHLGPQSFYFYNGDNATYLTLPGIVPGLKKKLNNVTYNHPSEHFV